MLRVFRTRLMVHLCHPYFSLCATKSFEGGKELSEIKQLIATNPIVNEIHQYIFKGSYKSWRNEDGLLLHKSSSPSLWTSHFAFAYCAATTMINWQNPLVLLRPLNCPRGHTFCQVCARQLRNASGPATPVNGQNIISICPMGSYNSCCL